MENEIASELEGDGQPDSYFEYELAGVLVHSGTAESGHYYSFIKVRRGPLKNKWFEFNDNHVTEWDVSQLRNECFGGEYEHSYGGNSAYYEVFDTARSRNAYLLFYERVSQKPEGEESCRGAEVPRPLRESVWQENLKYLKAKLFYDNDYFLFLREFLNCVEWTLVKDEEVRSQISYNDQQVLAVTHSRENAYGIKLAKMSFYDDDFPSQLEEEVFDPREQAEWESHTLKALMQTPPLKIFRLLFVYSYEMLLKSRDSNSFIESMNQLSSYLKINPAACFFVISFLTENSQILTELLFDNIHPDVKVAVAKILKVVIEKVAKLEESYILEFEQVEKIEQGKDLMPRVETQEIKKSSLIRFLDVMLRFLDNECKKYMNKSFHYFEIFKILVYKSPKLAKYISKMTRGFKALAQLFLACFNYSSETMLTINLVDTTRLNDNKPPELTILLDIISFIVCSSTSYEMRLSLPPTFSLSKTQLDDTFELDHEFREQFLRYNNFEWCFQPLGGASNAFKSIIQHLSWENERSSDRIMEMLVSMITKEGDKLEKSDELFQNVEALLTLEDSLQGQRVQMLFKDHKLTDSIQYHNRNMSSKYRMNCIRWIVDMSSRCVLLGTHIKKHANYFKWMIDYIEDEGPTTNSNHTMQLSKWQKTKQKLLEILDIPESEVSGFVAKPAQANEFNTAANEEEEKSNTGSLYFTAEPGLESLDEHQSG